MSAILDKEAFRSPNFDERKAEVSALVLHYTGMQTAHDALLRLCNASLEHRVSAHYVVSEEGVVYRLVEEHSRAWHAGKSFWRGCSDLNDRSVGIEIVNPGHEFDYRLFPPAQMEAVRNLAVQIIERHKIAAPWILAHSDIAPERKSDPGELFDWRFLAEGGVGFFPSVSSHELLLHEALREQRDAEAASKLQTLLTTMGYDATVGLKACATAFQRRWRRERVDGVPDAECVALAEAILHGWGEGVA